MDNKTVVVIGGYGNFGKRIVESLGQIAGIAVVIAGRCHHRALELATVYESHAKAQLIPAVLDVTSPSFEQDLSSLAPFLVIHTAGPFQGQTYSVAQACINVGAHYIDLADDRRFVYDITRLNEAARKAKVFVVSGASTVPGLSSVVIDEYYPRFSAIKTIDMAIAPGNKAERGFATVKGILSYTGEPFPVFSDGQWRHRYGWMSPRRKYFGGLMGQRWLANVDIPDLELYPKRYRVSDSVHFQAGLELPLIHFGLVGLAWLRRLRLSCNWATCVKPIIAVSECFTRFGTPHGGMSIEIKGINRLGKPVTVSWTLYADDGIGPFIPVFSALIVARKLIDGTLEGAGATPCVGLYCLNDVLPYFSAYHIHYQEQISE